MIVVSLFLIAVVMFAAAALITLPLMLFLGNLGLNLSFWGTLPGGIVLGIVGGSSASKTKT